MPIEAVSDSDNKYQAVNIQNGTFQDDARRGSAPSQFALVPHKNTAHLFCARVSRQHGHKRVLVEPIGQHTLREQRRHLHGGAHEAPVVRGLLGHAPLERRRGVGRVAPVAATLSVAAAAANAVAQLVVALRYMRKGGYGEQVRKLRQIQNQVSLGGVLAQTVFGVNS